MRSPGVRGRQGPVPPPHHVVNPLHQNFSRCSVLSPFPLWASRPVGRRRCTFPWYGRGSSRTRTQGRHGGPSVYGETRSRETRHRHSLPCCRDHKPQELRPESHCIFHRVLHEDLNGTRPSPSLWTTSPPLIPYRFYVHPSDVEPGRDARGPHVDVHGTFRLFVFRRQHRNSLGFSVVPPAPVMRQECCLRDGCFLTSFE